MSSQDLKTKRSPRKVHFELVADDKTSKRSNIFDQNLGRLAIQTKKDLVHGTNYVNGTLNLIQTRLPSQVNTCNAKSETVTRPIIFRNQFTNDASAKCARKNSSIDKEYWDNAVNRRGILLHVSSENQPADNIKFNKSRMRRYTSILMGSSNYKKRPKSQLLKSPKEQSPQLLELPPYVQLNKTQNDNANSENPFKKFSYKLISIKPAIRKPVESHPTKTQASEFDERASAIKCNAYNNHTELNHQCTGDNLSEILQLAHRWQSSAQSMPVSDNVSTCESSNSVEFCTLKKIDVKM